MPNDDFFEVEPAAATTSTLDWRRLVYPLLDKWWLIAASVAIALGLVTLYLKRAQTIYAATAVIKFESESPKILGMPDVVGGEVRSDEERKERLKEIQVVLKSPLLMKRVVEANQLAASTTNQSPPVTKRPHAVRVELRSGTSFIDVTVEQADPVVAAQLANSLVAQLIKLNSETYKALSRSATAFLAEEAEELQRKLTEGEVKLQTYKDQFLSLEQRQTLVADNLKELNQKVTAAKTDRIRLESEYAPMAALGNDVAALLNVARIAGDPAVAALRAGVAQQEIEFADVQKMYRPKHPTYIQSQGKLTQLQQALSNASLKAIQTMRVSFENAANQEKSLTAELERQEKLAQSINSQFVPYNTLLRDQEQYRILYDSVIKRMGESKLVGNLERRPIQIFQQATVPRIPVKPRRLLIALIGLGAGLGLGVFLALGPSLVDDSFRTVNDVEAFLRQPVLSMIPKLARRRSRRPEIVVGNDLPFSGAESFRALRTSLYLLDRESKQRSFLFTSTLAGEGKTFCSINFAASLAQQGLRTLLIDADLRRPMLETLLLGSRGSVPGLSDYLNGDPLTTHATKIANLSVLPAGRTVPNPSELLAQSGLRELLVEARRQFDQIVVDSAPIFGVSDTLRIAKDVQRVCVVILAGKTPRKLVQRSLQMLARAGTQTDGLILNAVADSWQTAYDNPYHDYGYANNPSVKDKRHPAPVPDLRAARTATPTPSEAV
jgi:capsular exopolysaccharide synthesis family protein